MQRDLLAPSLVAFLAACGPSASAPVGPGTTTSSSPTTSSPTLTTEPTDTTPTVVTDTGPPPIEFDCDTIPFEPLSVTNVTGASGYHDVAFTEDGRLIGAGGGNNSLMIAEYGLNAQVFVPNTGMVQQMVWLPDGDLAVASDIDGIVRVQQNGSWTVINGNIRPYGLILGPDGLLWAADQDKVHKVDPITGQASVVVPSNALDSGSPRVINFSLDYTKLFIGTYSGSNGRIYQVELDASYEPAAPAEVFATGVGSGAYHDGLGIDICGYLYVPDYSTSALYRIAPDGSQVQKLFDAGGLLNSDYGHGLEWGNNVGGWSDHAIYLPLSYDNNKVQEMVIGVPSREWTGGVAINQP